MPRSTSMPRQRGLSTSPPRSAVSTLDDDEDHLSPPNDPFLFDSFDVLEPLWRRLAKVTLITLAYTTAFMSIAQLAIFLFDVPKFPQPIVPTDLMTWVTEKWTHGVLWDATTAALLRNCGLLCLFGFVHSGLSSKRPLGRFIRQLEILDRALYVFLSGLALGTLVTFWESVPIVLWRMEWIEGITLYCFHGLGWILFYGTSLMLDLPDMVGYTQVIFTTPNRVIKSPEYQEMLHTQRHMGLVPFTITLIFHPLMTLDRFLMTVVTLWWMYKCWESDDSGFRYVTRMRDRRWRTLFRDEDDDDPLELHREPILSSEDEEEED